MEVTKSQYSRMKELTALLSSASEAYYNKDTEIMSNLEYDKLYDELADLEKKTGIVLAGSPTVHVGYTASDELPRERHSLTGYRAMTGSCHGSWTVSPWSSPMREARSVRP